MTVATIGPPAEAVAEAHELLHAVLRVTWPENRPARRAIGSAALDLDAAIDGYRLLADGSVRREAAAKVDAAARALRGAIGDHCGQGDVR